MNPTPAGETQLLRPSRRYTRGDTQALETFDQLPDGANVRLPVVSAIFGVCDGTVWRWKKLGVLGGYRKVRGCAMWQVGAVRALLNAQQK